MNFFKQFMIVLLKMHVSDKMFDRTCLKAVRVAFFPIYGVWSRGRGLNFLSGGDIKQKGKVQTFWLAGGPPKFSPLVGHPDLSIRKTLRRVIDLLTVMVLKKMSEIIFFQINIFTKCKFKGEN